jgi:hypothetical protein
MMIVMMIMMMMMMMMMMIEITMIEIMMIIMMMMIIEIMMIMMTISMMVMTRSFFKGPVRVTRRLLRTPIRKIVRVIPTVATSGSGRISVKRRSGAMHSDKKPHVMMTRTSLKGNAEYVFIYIDDELTLMMNNNDDRH